MSLIISQQLYNELRAHGEHHRAPVAGGVRMTDRAADRAHVADEWIGNQRRRIEENVQRAAQLRCALHVAMSGSCADPHMPVFSTDSLESINPPDINNNNWRRKS